MKEPFGVLRMKMGSRRGSRVLILLSLFLLALFPNGHSQDKSAEDKFNAASLRYRTTLHYDPLQEASLEDLVKLYLAVGRSDELIALYRNHISQYPDDSGALTVLIRILRRVDRAGADELIAAALPKYPNYAPLQYVMFRFYEERGDPRAPAALSRAIDLETDLSRRNKWFKELLDLSEGEEARKLALAHFSKLLEAEKMDTSLLLEIAQIAQRHRFWEQSRLALIRASSGTESPEQKLQIDLLLVESLKELNRRAEAERLLDSVLEKLAPDYRRRKEILVMRINLIPTEEERQVYLKSLADRSTNQPANESALIDWVETLIAADQQKEAINVLLTASPRFPKSVFLESETMKLLENSGDYARFVGYLSERLESEPERLDLRFRLSKAEFAIGQDDAGLQDFLVVIGGETPKNVAEKILELQTYLKEIDRAGAIASYLEKFVKEHPSFLNIARELAEIDIAKNNETAVNDLVAKLDSGTADSEDVLEFADFLLEAKFILAAQSLVEARLKFDSNNFALNLKLIAISGLAGNGVTTKERIATLREAADTPQRYSQWLDAAILAHQSLETLPQFLEDELSRYSFDEADWPDTKVERFLILCEKHRKNLVADRLADQVRKQLDRPNLNDSTRMRLRKILAGILEVNPALMADAVKQLQALITEDTPRRATYELRLALVYHRGGRPDLAAPIFSRIDYDEVDSPSLLRSASDVLIDSQMLREAARALETITKLVRSDFLSWERRISVLAALGDETALRSIIRMLQSGDKDTEDENIVLRERSREALRNHLEASYWRSISTILASDPVEEALPMLTALDQEDLGIRARFWSEWTRSRVLGRLNRPTEAREALIRLSKLAEARGEKYLSFPDGLTLALPVGQTTWVEDAGDVSSSEPTEVSLDYLFAHPSLLWIAELPDGVSVERILRSEHYVLILDSSETIRCLDSRSGKLLWKVGLEGQRERAHLPYPRVFDEVSLPLRIQSQSEENVIKTRTPPSIAVWKDCCFLVSAKDCIARSLENGEILWVKHLPDSVLSATKTAPRGARPTVSLVVDDGKLILFDPNSGDALGLETKSGKLLWSRKNETDRAENHAGESIKLASLNTGLALGDPLGLSYGEEVRLFDVKSGAVAWHFRKSQVGRFPVILRAPREGESAEDDQVSAAIESEGIEKFYDVIPSTSPETNQKGREFFSSSALILGPAVYWAESRFRQNSPAFAAVGDRFLWLMEQDRVHRISIDLPIESRQLPASGTFIGQSDEHLWFFDEGDLYHADFRRGKTTRISVRDLGAPSTIRFTLNVGRLVVRGNASMIMLNAHTGEILARASLPEALVRDLSEKLNSNSLEEIVSFVWQGQITRRALGGTSHCVPITDVPGSESYIAVCGGRMIACLVPSVSATPAVPPPASTTSTTPPPTQ